MHAWQWTILVLCGCPAWARSWSASMGSPRMKLWSSTRETRLRWAPCAVQSRSAECSTHTLMGCMMCFQHTLSRTCGHRPCVVF